MERENPPRQLELGLKFYDADENEETQPSEPAHNEDDTQPVRAVEDVTEGTVYEEDEHGRLRDTREWWQR